MGEEAPNCLDAFKSAVTQVAPNADSYSTVHGGDSSGQAMSPSMKVQLRPVGQPSPVTLLFEYALKAWGNQKGDHCTYRYLPSREPGSHMEMVATVLVRLPNKQPLQVRDTQPRASRVSAQNAVAQLALEKLAAEDSELADQLEALASQKPSFNSPPWQRRQYYQRQPHYYPQYGYCPEAASSEDFASLESRMYYPLMPPVMAAPIDTSGVSPLMEDDPMVTPTMPFAPYGYGYSPLSYMHPEMMYYPHMMMPVPMAPESGEDAASPSSYQVKQHDSPACA